jgi:flagellar hook-basal body complex protein FliE
MQIENLIPKFNISQLSQIDQDGSNIGESFINLVKDAYREKKNSINAADKNSMKALFKEADTVEVMASLSEAEIALQEIITIRDKVIASYNEIKNMNI